MKQTISDRIGAAAGYLQCASAGQAQASPCFNKAKPRPRLPGQGLRKRRNATRSAAYRAGKSYGSVIAYRDKTSSRGGKPVDEDSDDSSNQHAEQDIGNQLLRRRDV
jgi:hypothetical protein